MEHVHAYIIERTLIVWARQAKKLSHIITISANKKKARISTSFSLADIVPMSDNSLACLAHTNKRSS